MMLLWLAIACGWREEEMCATKRTDAAWLHGLSARGNIDIFRSSLFRLSDVSRNAQARCDGLLQPKSTIAMDTNKDSKIPVLTNGLALKYSESHHFVLSYGAPSRTRLTLGTNQCPRLQATRGATHVSFSASNRQG